MITEPKPGTPEETLQHFGVLGMKWGVRRSQGTKDFNAKFTTRKARRSEIERARVAQLSRQQKFRAAPRGSAERTQIKAEFLNHPDRATSLRLTAGEKFIAAGLIATVVAAPSTGVALAIRTGVQRKASERSGG